MLNWILNIFLKIFSKKIFYKINFIFLHIILKLIGYKNYGSYYETGEIFFLNKLKKFKIKTSIDVGANLGNYSSKLLEITKEKVISFEPMFYSFKKLEKLRKKNINKFFCFNYALSNKNEVKQINYVNKISQLATTSAFTKNIKFLQKYQFKKKKIKTITLDNFFTKNKKLLENGLDFIKIDTEGDDYNVICGSVKTIKKYKPKFIQFEMNSHNLFKGETLFKFKNIMNNYKTYRMLPYNNGLLEVNPDYAENNIFHLSIYVLIRRDINLL
jgi:FkbM family methyltransferase